MRVCLLRVPVRPCVCLPQCSTSSVNRLRSSTTSRKWSPQRLAVRHAAESVRADDVRRNIGGYVRSDMQCQFGGVGSMGDGRKKATSDTLPKPGKVNSGIVLFYHFRFVFVYSTVVAQVSVLARALSPSPSHAPRTCPKSAADRKWSNLYFWVTFTAISFRPRHVNAPVFGFFPLFISPQSSGRAHRVSFWSNDTNVLNGCFSMSPSRAYGVVTVHFF